MHTHSPAEKRRVLFFYGAEHNKVGGRASDTGRPSAARDVAPGQSWAFTDHRTMAEVIADEVASRSPA